MQFSVSCFLKEKYMWEFRLFCLAQLLLVLQKQRCSWWQGRMELGTSTGIRPRIQNVLASLRHVIHFLIVDTLCNNVHNLNWIQIQWARNWIHPLSFPPSHPPVFPRSTMPCLSYNPCWKYQEDLPTLWEQNTLSVFLCHNSRNAALLIIQFRASCLAYQGFPVGTS